MQVDKTRCNTKRCEDGFPRRTSGSGESARNVEITTMAAVTVCIQTVYSLGPRFDLIQALRGGVLALVLTPQEVSAT